MIAAPPDFVVTQVEVLNGPNGPSGYTSGSQFRVRATVCNRGGETGGADVGFYLSLDTNIAPAQDALAGTLPAGAALVPGECGVREGMVTANVPMGAWYVGAIADPSNKVPEYSEVNNTLAGGQVGVGTRPDFVVTSVTGPSLLKLGQSFTANVTVCNQGTLSDSTLVNVLLSADAVITETDRVIAGAVSVGTLNPGQCVSRAVQTSAQAPTQGAWYLGAFVDQGKLRTELIETNNTRAGTLIGVGTRPDFVVTAVTGAPRMALRNEPFSATLTVCNQGNVLSGTSVELFLSQDAVFTREQDWSLGGVSVGALSPGACATVPLTARNSLPADGEYYLGAIVDVPNSVPELIETNNTYTAGRMGIGSRPDLTITKLTGPAYAPLGSSFDASVTVCNQGTAPGGAFVDLLLSKDAVIVPQSSILGEGDLQVLRTSVGSLMPGACITLPVKARADFSFSLPEGEYRLGAIIDPANTLVELFESNNAYAGSILGVGMGPDLVVDWVRAPPSVVEGSNFVVSARVCNRGPVGAGSTDLVFAMSSDPEVLLPEPLSQGGDVFLGSAGVGFLLPGQCSHVPAPVIANVPEGAWYLGALLDPGNLRRELIESNNTAVFGPMGVGSKPDFIVTKVSGPASVHSGEPFDVSVTVCNQGTLSSGTDVTLLVSADEILTPPGPGVVGDAVAVEGSVGPLAPGACQAVPLRGSVAVPEGPYYLGVIADMKNLQAELIESNNSRVAERMGIGSKPDFLITALTAPATARPGTSFPASIQVCNQGTERADTEVELLLSRDEVITSPGRPGWDGDVSLGRFSVGPLERGQCRTVPVVASLPSSGPARELRLGAIVDSMELRPELIESNNVYGGGVIGVGGEQDFVVTELKPAASVKWGDPLGVTLTVCNQGFMPGSTEVWLLLSPDEVITFPRPSGPAPDDKVGSLSTGTLDSGQCITRWVQVSASSGVGDGAYYLGAAADPGNVSMELIESNNTRVAGPIGVGSGPDIVVRKVEGSKSARSGGLFSVSATVCNEGTAYGSPHVSFFLSQDTVFDAPGLQGSGDVIVHGASLEDLAPGQCTLVQAVPQAPVGDGVWHLGAIVGGLGAIPELIVSNNVMVGGVMGVGNQPDFIVTKVEGPELPRPDEPLWLNATVCNQGTETGSAWLEMLLSREPLTSMPSSSSWDITPVGGTFVGNVWAGQCVSARVRGSVPMLQGPWYLVGVVDGSPELQESNNVLTGGVMGLGHGPDLIVTKVTGLKNVQPGDSLALSATVCNQGDMRGNYTDVVFALSPDAVISRPMPPFPEDVVLGNAFADPLEPGQCSTVPLVVSVPYLENERWYLGAFVDSGDFTQELIESNNMRVEGPMGVGYGPDFVVTEVTAPARAYPEEPFSLSATVCNQGTAAGSTHLTIGLSPVADPFFPSFGDVVLGNTSLGSLLPGQCSTQHFSTSVFSYHEGEHVVFAMAETGGSWELVESNNRREGGVVGVGHGPDFVVTEVTGPASVPLGTLFEASATVCNQGLVSGSPDLGFYLSHDERIVPPGVPFEAGDFEYGSDPVGPLAPGECRTLQRTLHTGSAQEGAYYLGAAVDPIRALRESLESNNTRAGPRMEMVY
ncbi:hypothetical protein BO221_03625 [Archangium sp. Cb G35]|nr:hypothetical protein BO221_03625 [Archangium sp. Cb G35]